MVLMRIEVCDFKSYRGRQVIGPFRNFTSVIGPNGAGKSNLMDAISFVLGVKSAQLRSSQLRDLVYRGRRLASEDPSQDGEEDERGEADAEKAWVLAVYEDANEKEWKFQRTIWTNGNSEYKLNGRVVTYSTYNAALVSHNILVKAKNFLVFQGDVEAVASQSSKELTRLIEQISGSLELEKDYEKARDAQERATENATFNFNRRRNIAGEIKQYKEQKTEADKFEQIVQERDELILGRMLWKLWHIEEGLERNTREIKSKNKELEGLRADRDVRDQQLTAARAQQATSRTTVIQKERQIKRAEQTLEALRPTLLENDTRIAHSSRKMEKAHAMSEQVERDVNSQEKKVADLQKTLDETRAMADAAAAEAQAQAEQGAALSQESLEEYRRLKARANVLAVEERQALETLTRDEKTSKRALGQLREKQEGLTQRRERLLEEEGTQETKKDDLQETVERLQRELAEAKQKLDNYQAEQAKNAQLEKELNEKLHDVYNKILQAGVEQRESEREAKLKETLSNLQRIFPGVRGRVIDLCQPTARKYETAISVILGRNIDAVVVDEERTAIECIEYMRNQRAGQATFIPLDTIQVKPINDKFRSFARGARLAVDVITFDAAVERAIHHACGNALICDTMEIARYVCYEKGQEVKAVTLEGTVIHKSGLITGGRSTHGSGKKWDDKEVQELPRVRDRLINQLRELNKTKSRGKMDENLMGEVNRLESSLTVARDDLSACDLRLKGIKEELSHLKKELKSTAPALTKAEKDNAALLSRIEGLQSTVDEAEDGVFADFCSDNGLENIRQYEQRQLKVAEQESEARVRFETQIARLNHQTRFEDEQLQARKQRLATLQSTVANEETALVELQKKKEETQTLITQAEGSLETLKSELEVISRAQEDKNTAVDVAKRAASKASKALDLALKEISVKNDEIEKLALERSSAYRKCRLENIPLPIAQGNLRDVPMEETLRDEMAMEVDEDEDNTQQPKAVADYGIEIEFDSLEDEDREDGSNDRGDQYDKEIAEKNAEIERMAPNMKAVDRLEDVEAKLVDTEKEAQKTRNDSKTARDKFNDIKKKRSDLFNQAYTHISERIDQVYKELTKGKAAPMGGVAYLTLENDEEPYLGGVKYHAMPPMKRFRDMEQLSGGEKTVAALALLFAIHSYQPSPFFVLDEVDAALDNTNVAKIANYIRTHASESFQFIVISLKGSLYERGQSLVGIYRDQEVNSSRTLTLDLTQYDE